MNRVNRWRNIAVLLFLFMITHPAVAQRFSVVGGDGLYSAYYEDYRSTSGINAVLVVYGTADKELQFDAPTTEPITWYTYEDVLNALPSVQEGNSSRLPLSATECGYVVMHAGKPYYLYVIDYIKHPLVLSGVSIPDNGAGCDVVEVAMTGMGKEMVYYHFNNMMPHEVERDITISYNTLQWNEMAEQYDEVSCEVVLPQYTSSYPVAAPLCNTTFTVTGDRFLKEWNMLQEVTTPTYQTIAVEARSIAVQTYREELNEIDRNPTGLGGSAPAEIEFNAYYTDAVTHVEWQFSKEGNFSTITHRYADDLLRYTFREEGTTYVRLVVSSANESCIYECDPLVVTIGTSMLEIPNAFSPGTVDGKNDEWRVAFKSLVEFRCWIFNKQGVEMFYTDNPGKGWDGKYGGRLASPGVYYYVIEARGADGVEYKRSGHINLMRSKKNSNSTTDTEQEQPL